jgi:hypothetical protein
LGIVVIGAIVVPWAVAAGVPGDVVAPGAVVVVVPPVWDRAAPAPMAVRTIANAAFLAAMFMIGFLLFHARIPRL